MKRFFGFTLSELMIAITVLGVLCAAVMPAVLGNNPNHNKMMMKKAYYTFSEVVNELVNDIEYYPSIDGICPDDKENGYLGFDCGQTASDSKLPFLFTHSINTKTVYDSDETVFAANTEYQASSSSSCIGVASSCYSIVSNDGMIWTFPKSTYFTKGSSDSYITIGVDINGSKLPNAYQTSSGTRDKNFDQFRMLLYADGKIEIPEDEVWAAEALQVSSALTEDD